MQACSEVGCVRPAAFRTRMNPAWCDEHITAILRRGGLEPLKPFEGQKKWRLTRCLVCGCEAHYRFEYTLAQNGIGVATCRACFWRSWAAQQRGVLEGCADLTPPSIAVAKAHTERHGFEYLGPLTNPSLRDDPHRTKCNYCGRIAAQRLGDIGWGCQCQTNPRRSAQTSNVSGFGKPGAKPKEPVEGLQTSGPEVVGPRRERGLDVGHGDGEGTKRGVLVVPGM